MHCVSKTDPSVWLLLTVAVKRSLLPLHRQLLCTEEVLKQIPCFKHVFLYVFCEKTPPIFLCPSLKFLTFIVSMGCHSNLECVYMGGAFERACRDKSLVVLQILVSQFNSI